MDLDDELMVLDFESGCYCSSTACSTLADAENACDAGDADDADDADEARFAGCGQGCGC